MNKREGAREVGGQGAGARQDPALTCRCGTCRVLLQHTRYTLNPTPQTLTCRALHIMRSAGAAGREQLFRDWKIGLGSPAAQGVDGAIVSQC